MGTGGTQLWLQAGWWEWGRASICSSQRQQLSAVQSASPARPWRPRTQPAAICDREIGDALGTREVRGANYLCPHLSRTRRAGSAWCSQEGLFLCLCPPLCGPEAWAPQC